MENHTKPLEGQDSDSGKKTVRCNKCRSWYNEDDGSYKRILKHGECVECDIKSTDL